MWNIRRLKSFASGRGQWSVVLGQFGVTVCSACKSVCKSALCLRYEEAGFASQHDQHDPFAVIISSINLVSARFFSMVVEICLFQLQEY